MNKEEKELEVTDFINGQVRYDRDGQYFWIETPDEGLQMLAELRGWGAIQNLPQFSVKGKPFLMAQAGRFQDKIGQWIADAINSKRSYSAPPPSEASREEMINTRIDECITDFKKELKQHTNFGQSTHWAETYAKTMLKTFAKWISSQFPTANVTHGEVERIKKENELLKTKVLTLEYHKNNLEGMNEFAQGEMRKMRELNEELDRVRLYAHEIDTVCTQLRTTIDDQAKEIERLNKILDNISKHED